MIKTKNFSSSSSIPISFASVFLFSTLFAACCFTFLYFQPHQEDHGSDDRIRDINNFNLVNSPPATNPRTKMGQPQNRQNQGPISPNPATIVEDLVNSNSPEGLKKDGEDGSGGSKELVSSTPPPKMAEEDVKGSAPKPGNSTAAVNSTSMVAEGGTDHGLIKEEISSSSTISVNSTSMVEDGADHSVIEEQRQQMEDGADQSVIDEQQDELNWTAPTVNRKDEYNGEDFESTPVFEDLYLPPSNISAEERILWFKERVPRMKIFESTKKTRVFDQRIQGFFTGCEVRIFMTWISTSRLFGKRELLALESVLKAHPKGCVVIVSKSMDSKRGRSLIKPIVDLGHKVLPVAPDLSLLFDNTPAGAWLQGLKAGEFDPGMIPITQNLSSLLRLVLLYKYGGLYMDVDVIVIKDVSELRNCVGIQEVDGAGRIWKSLNNAVLIFDQKHPLLLKLIEEFTANFSGNVWGHNGPYLLSRVVMKLAFSDPAYDFNILSPNAFYPVDWDHIPRYFRQPKTANETQWTYDEAYVIETYSYGIHLWNQFTRELKIEQQSIIGRLISDHCIICKDVYDTYDSTSTSASTSASTSSSSSTSTSTSGSSSTSVSTSL